MDFLVRFAQQHESFRRHELEALADLHNLQLQISAYSDVSPFCTVRLPSVQAARAITSRLILAKAIYELWGVGSDYEALHASVRASSSDQWPAYKDCSFKFSIDSYQGSRSTSEQREIVESFSYMGFKGPIRMTDAAEEFTVFEQYDLYRKQPKRVFLGRLVGRSAREIVGTYSLKQRKYIATTSMDSELALVMANIALAAPGKLFYDPFVGTGSLPIACSHFGALSWGSDIDGRTVRGKGSLNVRSSFAQYGLEARYLGGFIGDLTHSPLRLVQGGWLDGIVCDPPYGVREGLKVLGTRDGGGKGILWIDGKQAHLQDEYLPPKRPYSFEAMLGDILVFAAQVLVTNGRLSLWMPTANDAEQELDIPKHTALDLVSVCTQPFNKWSRRLLTYKRNVSHLTQEPSTQSSIASGMRADDLNSFRKRYFEGFKTDAESGQSTQ